MQLRRITNFEYEYVDNLARQSGTPLEHCPTCGAKPLTVDENTKGWVNGVYKIDGVEHPCDCQRQMAIRKHYLLANIGDQYMRLNWERDFTGDEKIKEAVALYIAHWKSAKVNGMGIEFSSPRLGVGKTFAATYIAKEIVKRGESVLFMPFIEMVSLFGGKEEERQVEKVRNIQVIVLDEVVPSVSSAQHNLFARQFEEIIRYRTNFNKVTIMTTNLTPEALREEYPRTYSLLEAKQIRVEVVGEDARQNIRGLKNLEIIANMEVEPIC